MLKHTAAKLMRRSYWDGNNDRGSPSHAGVPQDRLSTTASFYVKGITIKLAEEGDSNKPEGTVRGETISARSVERALPCYPKSEEKGSVERVLRSGEKVSPSCLKSSRSAKGVPSSLRSGEKASLRSSASTLSRWQPLQQEESKWMWLGPERAEKVIPREWYVLSYPLPEVSSVPQSLLASLKESVKESLFHESIYYSKKKVCALASVSSVVLVCASLFQCDEELERTLNCPPEDYIRPPPPRVQNIQDLVIGGRSILTASALIKSLKP